MSKFLALYRRELAYYFQSPVAYAVVAVFLLFCGYSFYNLLGYFNLLSIQVMQNPLQARSLSITASVLAPLFSNMSTILLLILPLLTMRLFAEERRSGSAELLFTYPVSDAAVIAEVQQVVAAFLRWDCDLQHLPARHWFRATYAGTPTYRQYALFKGGSYGGGRRGAGRCGRCSSQVR